MLPSNSFVLPAAHAAPSLPGRAIAAKADVQYVFFVVTVVAGEPTVREAQLAQCKRRFASGGESVGVSPDTVEL